MSKVWRPSWPTRLAAVAGAGFAVFLIAGNIVYLAKGGSSLKVSDDVFLFAIAFCLLTISVRALFFLSVEIDSENLTARNVFSTKKCPLRDITDIAPGYAGITFRTESQSFVASAAQKSNLSKWLGRTSRADVVAEEIRAEIRRAKRRA